MVLLRSDLLPATGIGYFFKVNLLRYDEKKFIYGKHSCAATPRSIFKVNSLLIRREEGTFSWVRTAGRSANLLQPGILISRRCRTAKLLTPPPYSKFCSHFSTPFTSELLSFPSRHPSLRPYPPTPLIFSPILQSGMHIFRHPQNGHIKIRP